MRLKARYSSGCEEDEPRPVGAVTGSPQGNYSSFQAGFRLGRGDVEGCSPRVPASALCCKQPQGASYPVEGEQDQSCMEELKRKWTAAFWRQKDDARNKYLYYSLTFILFLFPSLNCSSSAQNYSRHDDLNYLSVFMSCFQFLESGCQCLQRGNIF